MNRIRRFLVRDDPKYQAFVDRYQAKTPAAKLFYLFMHLLPRLLAYLVINVPPVYCFAPRTTGVTGTMQGFCLVAVIFVRHMIVPVLALRYLDKPSFWQSLAFLGFRRFDIKAFFFVTPTTAGEFKCSEDIF